MKVLIVDDSTTMRKILINTLKTVGMEDIEEACDGEQAVEILMARQFDIVLMDWNMPKMLGIDALKRIRLSGNNVPVIMVTTETEKSRVIEALKAGANNYVIKPFKPEAIITKIQDVLAATKTT